MYEDKIELIQTNLDAIKSGITTICTTLKPNNNDVEKEPFIVATKCLITESEKSISRISKVFDEYKCGIMEMSSSMISSFSSICKEINDSFNTLECTINEYKNNTVHISESINIYENQNHKEPHLFYSNSMSKPYTMDVELIQQYPCCYYNKLYTNPDLWTDTGDIYIDCEDTNHLYIEKYMKNDDNLIKDIKLMDCKERECFIKDLEFIDLPIKWTYIKELCFDDDKMIMEAWKNNRILLVDEKNAPYLNQWLKKNNKFDNLFNTHNINEIHYNRKNNQIYVNIHLNYISFIENYCRTGMMDADLITKVDLKYEDIFNEMKSLGFKIEIDELYRVWKENRYVFINNQLIDILNDKLKEKADFKDFFYKHIQKKSYIRDHNHYYAYEQRYYDYNTSYDDDDDDRYDDYDDYDAQLIIFINLQLIFFSFIKYYFVHKVINPSLLVKERLCSYEQLEREMALFDIDIKYRDMNIVFKKLNSFLSLSSIITESHDDALLQEWIDYKHIQLIFKASENKYSSYSFHEYCNDKGPTLIIIKTTKGYILGGYTTKSWNGYAEYKNDPEAFIFTLKNPHDVPGTKYNKRKESEYAIYCGSAYGPCFCNGLLSDICISDRCNDFNNCTIYNNGSLAYDGDPTYKTSLFVNSNSADKCNGFYVAEYEVYTCT